MKKATTLFLFILSSILFSQETLISENDTVKRGVITLINDETLDVENLYKKGDKIYYTNLESGDMEYLFEPSVKKITDLWVNDSHSTIKMGDFPDGIYTEIDDFVNKNPDTSVILTPRDLVRPNEQWPSGKEVPEEVFFYDKKKNLRIRNVFAVVYNGEIYFQRKSILLHRHKKDKAQTTNKIQSFTRVKKAGDNYLYTELTLVNAWAQGFAYGAGGAVGGVMASNMDHVKGIVWDFKNKEFNIFRNCKDYNEFIKEVYPEGVQTCKKQQADIFQIREAIDKIK